MLFRVEVSTSGRKTSNQTAMAAYRSGQRLVDQHGQAHSYSRRTAVMESWLVMPSDAPQDWDRERLWQEVGLAEKRKDLVLVREILIELPAELSPQERKRLVQEHAEWFAAKYQTAVDVALHKPTRHQDSRHFHAHLMAPTRVITSAGLGRKLTELNLWQGGRQHVHAIREHVALVINAAFERSQRPERVDARSKRRQKLEQKQKLGAKIAQLREQITTRNRSERMDEKDMAEWQKKLQQAREEMLGKERENGQEKSPRRREIELTIAKLREKVRRRYKGIER